MGLLRSLRFSGKEENSLISRAVLATEEGLCSKTLVKKNDGNILTMCVLYKQSYFKHICLHVRAVTAQWEERWATGWTIGVLGLDSRRGLGIFLFTTASKTALRPTQPHIQWVPGAYLHLVPRSNKVWCYNSTPPIRLHGLVFS